MINPGRPVKDIQIDSTTSLEKIFEELSQSGGFESVNLSSVLEILTEMISDKQCLRFVSFVGAVVSTGLRGIIKDMIKNKWFDVVITTCGALDHDIARHFSHYKEGDFTMDDMELANQNIHRLGNVLVPMDSYGPLIEEKMQGFLEEEYQNGIKEMTTSEICKMIGKHLGEDSFLYCSYKKDIDDVRESPSLELIELLKGKGAKVDYNDPYIPQTHKMRDYDLKMKSKKLTEKMLKSYDLALIATAHSDYDYNWIVQNSQLVVDTRNATVNVKKGRKKIVKA